MPEQRPYSDGQTPRGRHAAQPSPAAQDQRRVSAQRLPAARSVRAGRAEHAGRAAAQPVQRVASAAEQGGSQVVGNAAGQSVRSRATQGAARSQRAPKKGGPWRVVFWVALAVLVASLVALGVIAFSYWQGQNSYNQVADQAFGAPDDIAAAPLSELTVDWDALTAINPDTVGWIYVPGTPINYPIVHTTDDEMDLTHDFQGSEGWIATFGAIFLAAANAPDFTDANNIMYGHHLNDGSMFAAIAGFDDQVQFDAHRTVYLLTPKATYRLRTFALVHVAANDPLAQTSFADAAEQTAYVQDKIDRSVVQVSDVPAASELTRTFALATCDNLPSDGRYVLYASIEESSGDASGTTVNPLDADAIDAAAKEAA